MQTHFYLSISPIEALIASQLEPEAFGRYMAIGTKNGSHEYIMFIEVSGEFGSDFDWEYARTRCVSHENGEPKHSLWMSVYRVLEHIPTDVMGAMYLTTADGRSLVLEQAGRYIPEDRPFHVYQELTPLTPLVVSSLDPAGFAASLTNPDEHVSVPRVAFADLKVIDFDDMTTTGNIGAAYDRNLEHLKECIRDVTSSAGKPSKNVERSVGAFSYQIIGDGVFIGDRTGVVMYEMPDITSIRRNHYEWGRSAMLF
ncbi:MAG: hypothetical protein PF508_07835 [Spirochaeta sp.]|jgi:hypothetical protein|nr:hypothetical protein [Spirochaeta sp.]